MASSSSSQETGSSNQKASAYEIKRKRTITGAGSEITDAQTKKSKKDKSKASKPVKSSASKRKRGKGESSITVDVVLEAAAQVWDTEVEEDRIEKKKTFEEKYDKMIADKKQRKADYLAARDAKLKSLGLENCDEYFVQKIAEVKQIAGSDEQQADEEAEKMLELIPEVSEEKNREARGSRCG